MLGIRHERKQLGMKAAVVNGNVFDRIAILLGIEIVAKATVGLQTTYKKRG